MSYLNQPKNIKAIEKHDFQYVEMSLNNYIS